MRKTVRKTAVTLQRGSIMVSGSGRSTRSVKVMSEAIDSHGADPPSAHPPSAHPPRAHQPSAHGHLVVSATQPEVVMSAPQRTSLGLDHWIDGTFGVSRTPHAVLMCSPNGPRTALHRLDAGAREGSSSIDQSFLTSRLITPDATIEPRDRSDRGNSHGHARDAGGPVFDHASGGRPSSCRVARTR